MATKEDTNQLYVSKLTVEARNRYYAKLSLIDNTDPYQIEKSQWSESVEHWATVEHADIVNFLVYTTSFITYEAIKAYKSLDSYNQFLNGWVGNVRACKINGICVHTAEVSK